LIIQVVSRKPCGARNGHRIREKASSIGCSHLSTNLSQLNGARHTRSLARQDKAPDGVLILSGALSHVPTVQGVEQRLCPRFLLENEMYQCAFCSSTKTRDKYFCCPSSIWRPNMYSVCAQHEHMTLSWEDVYPTEDCKPITRHESKLGIL